MSYVIAAEAVVFPSGMLLSLFTARVTVHMSSLQSREQNIRVNKENDTQTHDYFSTLGSLLKSSIDALRVYSANAQEHNGHHSVTEIIQICYSDIDISF